MDTGPELCTMPGLTPAGSPSFQQVMEKPGKMGA
jgi:hypothetical protein